jgi:DNA-binding transcriptional LysR family regulator
MIYVLVGFHVLGALRHQFIKRDLVLARMIRTLAAGDVESILKNTLDGIGIGCMPEPMVATHIAQGRLVALLDGWAHTLPGVFLYHLSRRQTLMPLEVFLRFVEKWPKRAPTANHAAASDGKRAKHKAVRR